jgi:outer membrane receptor protein involved in Fe transport
VQGRRASLVGEAVSASEGVVGRADIAARPMLRTGDLLEFVPGLIATAHSGSGKANQYFLRGFNLDHGTDFATSVDGMPVNMRSHGHGQGYTDLNFIIPEMVDTLSYRKGNYYADVGDFSSAGSAEFRLLQQVAEGRASLAVGENGYARATALGSAGPDQRLVYGLELQTYDGPWTDIREDVGKVNLMLRQGFELAGGQANVTVMGYRNRWNSADQIPQRAVDQGLIGEFGSIDTTLGGESSRYSLSGGWAGRAFEGDFELRAYAIDYALDLWSNFTYLLDDPIQGDQFQQVDERQIYGFIASQQWQSGRSRWRVGAEGRFDDIGRVALLRTTERRVTGTVRDDAVEQGSLGVHAAHEYELSDRLRSYLGLRRDQYRFDVDASLPANSGDTSDGITSTKASLAYQASSALELYASYGTGFHSNDARGTTITQDPVSGDPASRVDPLVSSEGAELGARLHAGNGFLATLAVWTLSLDSELLFVGDAGTTEATRPSQRDGVELAAYWYPSERYTFNLEAAYTDARFDDRDPAGREIPGAIPLVLGGGFTVHPGDGWMGSLQVKHFGRYPLIEDNSVKSEGSTLVNLRVGRESARWGLFLDVLNLLDRRDHDIDYFYASRLAGEPAAGIEDIHYHVFPAREARISLQLAF